MSDFEKRLEILKKANGDFRVEGFVGDRKVFQLRYETVFHSGSWYQSSFSVPRNIEEFTEIGHLIVSASPYMKLIEDGLFMEDEKTIIVNQQQ